MTTELEQVRAKCDALTAALNALSDLQIQGGPTTSEGLQLLQMIKGLAKTSIRCAVLPPQEAAAEPVAWQAENGGHSYVSHEARAGNGWLREEYTIPLYTTQPDTTALLLQARDALTELAECGAEAWSSDRPCVAIGNTVIAAINKHLGEQS